MTRKPVLQSFWNWKRVHVHRSWYDTERLLTDKPSTMTYISIVHNYHLPHQIRFNIETQPLFTHSFLDARLLQVHRVPSQILLRFPENISLALTCIYKSSFTSFVLPYPFSAIYDHDHGNIKLYLKISIFCVNSLLKSGALNEVGIVCSWSIT